MCRKAENVKRIEYPQIFRYGLYKIIYSVKITMRKNIIALGDPIEYLIGIIRLIKDNDLSSRIKIEDKDMESCMDVCSYMGI